MKPFSSILPAIVAVAAITGLTACGEKETAAVGPPEVLVVEASTRDVPVYREWIGTIDGSENAEIRARVTGYLINRDYQEGALVKKGDPLFEIDPRPFEAALAQAKSQLEEGRAAEIATQAEKERSDRLFAQKVISPQEHTNKTQLYEASRAKVQALQAAVEDAQLNLNFCKVVAPFNGLVGIAKAQVGDLVGTGSNVVLTSISKLDPAKVLFRLVKRIIWRRTSVSRRH
jgi:RND family efflux transporter MFP subunit